MGDDSSGFRYPQVDLSRCTECGACRRACPVLNPAPVNGAPDAYACRAIDEAVRLASSSGGAFTLLAGEVLDRGGAVFGAAFDEDFTLVHQCAESRADLGPLRGSKYVQSQVGMAYAQIEQSLRQDRPVLFSGTPCQVAGLKSFLRREYESLLCVDMICHGVPSPRVWRSYLEFQERLFDGKARGVSFRRKDEGWRRFSLWVHFGNGAEYRSTLSEDPYLRAFLSDICLRPTCYACAFKGLQRHSDITLADFWGIEHVLPDLDDDTGTSLVLVNSPKGRVALDGVAARMQSSAVSLEAAVMYNPAALRSAHRHPRSDAFYRNLNTMSFDRLVRRYCSPSLWRRARRLLARAVRNLRAAVAR